MKYDDIQIQEWRNAVKWGAMKKRDYEELTKEKLPPEYEPSPDVAPKDDEPSPDAASAGVTPQAAAAPDADKAEWLVELDNRQQVQVNKARLLEMLRNKEITRQHMIWKEGGDSDWAAIETVEELKETLKKLPPPSPSERAEAERKKAEAAAAARAKIEEEDRAKLEAKLKADAEAEAARIRAAAAEDAERIRAQAKAEAEMRARIEAEERAKIEAQMRRTTATPAPAQTYTPSSSSVTSSSQDKVEWWVFINDKKDGPYNKVMLRLMLKDFKITGTSLVWKPGMTEWVQLKTVPELQNLHTSSSLDLPAGYTFTPPQRQTMSDKEIQEMRQMVAVGVMTKDIYKDLTGMDY